MTGTPSVRAPEGPLRVPNLFSTLPDLARLAASELERESWLDGYLLTAGVSQLIDDHLQPDPLALRRATALLVKDGGSIGRAVAATVTGPSANALDPLVRIGPASGRVRRLQMIVDAGLQQLADLVVEPGRAMVGPSSLGDLKECYELLDGSPSRLPRALRDEIVRLPACFRSFDQHPEDLRRVVRDFADAHPDRFQPLLVVGVRTSGSYLAPLYAAHLRAEGYAEVDALTMRPGRRVHARDGARLRALAARGGLALLCDDPPGTGGSIARVATQLQKIGIPQGCIVLLLALFEDADELPPVLAGYESVLLRFEDWSIHRRLGADAVRDGADQLLGPDRDVLAAERVRLRVPRSGRGHLKAVFRLTVADARTGSRGEEYLSVEGVGLGYFGNHAIAVVEPLHEFLAPVFGVRDGLLFRKWMPDDARADLLPPEARVATASRIAKYIFTRNRLLGLTEDVTLRQSGQYPVWEAVSMLVSRACGPAWPVGRTLVTDRVVKRLLRVSRPSVIDGRAELSQWFTEDGPEGMVKVDWDQGSSWNLGLGCCDPVFDLAGVAAGSQDAAFARDLRAAYDALQGEPIDEERWLLYQLAHLWALPDTRPEGRHALRRACSRSLQAYFRRVYFDDLVLDDDGPLCGIDVDGVLETDYLGFPALTPASAGALRALHAHGYRPLIVTGRSLSEVVERCQAYRLVGGVAEYGSATYVSRGGVTTALTGSDERGALERLRSELRTKVGVNVNDDYAYAIRAYSRDGRGARGPVPEDLLADAQRVAAAERVSAIVGDAQTDLIGDSVNKGRAVRSLVAALAARDAGGADAPLAFAVGDTVADISLLALAQRPFAPGHAKKSLGDRATVTRKRYQAGFADAVGHLIGHDPGTCSQCRLGPASRDRLLLLGLLGLREGGIERVPAQIVKLATLANLPRRAS